MKKLEDIPRKPIYHVPDGYFERLPQVIQSRVSHKPQGTGLSLSWGWALRVAVPVLALAVALWFWWPAKPTVEEQLAAIDVGQLTLYLNDTDLTTEDLLETVTWSSEDLEALEETVYSTMDLGAEADEWIEALELNLN
ncbi:MAG: hypothetical protein ACOYXA_12985 [Bacteroidota bacterium]